MSMWRLLYRAVGHSYTFHLVNISHTQDIYYTFFSYQKYITHHQLGIGVLCPGKLHLEGTI